MTRRAYPRRAAAGFGAGAFAGRLRFLILAVLSALSLVFATAANRTWAADRLLRLGILPVLDTLPLQVAVSEKFFEKHGLNVELVSFDSALERDAAMQAGQLEAYFGDMVNTVLVVQGGVPMRIVTVSYASRPGQRQFAVVGRPGLEAASLHDLPSGSLGLSNATIMEYLVDLMEERGLVPRGRFERLEVKKIPIRMQMLLGGRLDLAILPEPLVSLAESQGARVYADDQSLEVTLTVIGIVDRLLQDPAGVGERFLAAYGEAVDALSRDPEKYRKLMAESCRIPESLRATFRIPAFPRPGLPPTADVERLLSWMEARGLMNRPLKADDLVWSVRP
ncbi:MAG: ABC transporter substrate-binding protein [Desulfosoma sp.]